jgi:hypothetical protein
MIEIARAFIEAWTSENVHVSKKELEQFDVAPNRVV